MDIAGRPPSAELARALSGLDLSRLNADELVDVVAGWEKLASWVQAGQNESFAALALATERNDTPWHSGESTHLHELGLAVGLSYGTVNCRLADAITLVESLPEVSAALRAGTITTSHARVAVRAVTGVSSEIASEVDRAVFADRDRWNTPGQLERALARSIATVDPDGAEGRRRARVRQRDVRFRDETDAMTSMWALFASEDARLMANVIDAHARSSAANPDCPEDVRTLAQRRADVLLALVTRRGEPTVAADNGSADSGVTSSAASDGGCYDRGHGGAGNDEAGSDQAGGTADGGADESALTEDNLVRTAGSSFETDRNGPTNDSSDGDEAAGDNAPGPDEAPDASAATDAARRAPIGPTAHGRRPTIGVTVAWTTLIGLDDAPADLTGYGPIDAATARRIAADPTATWRRLLVEPRSGRLLDIGRTKYRPPADLADHVITRDVMCRFPTCERPAMTCDLDHRHAWDAGGVTATHNLDAVCRMHHGLKHDPGWSHERDPINDDSIWLTPRGRVVRKKAAKLPAGDDQPADVGPPPF